MDRELHGRLDELQRDPFPHYVRARRSEGLTQVPELDARLVARDADVREVLRRPDEFSSASALLPDVLPAPAALAVLGGGFGGQPVVVTADGARHQRLRAPIVRGLSPARGGAVLPYAAERAAALVDAFAEDGRVEPMTAYANAEPDRVPAAIEEAARYDSALQGFRRVTTRTVTLAGTELPPGSSLFVAFGAANRDGGRPQAPYRRDRRSPPRPYGRDTGRTGRPPLRLRAPAPDALICELFGLPEERRADTARLVESFIGHGYRALPVRLAHA